MLHSLTGAYTFIGIKFYLPLLGDSILRVFSVPYHTFLTLYHVVKLLVADVREADTQRDRNPF